MTSRRFLQCLVLAALASAAFGGIWSRAEGYSAPWSLFNAMGLGVLAAILTGISIGLFFAARAAVRWMGRTPKMLREAFTGNGLYVDWFEKSASAFAAVCALATVVLGVYAWPTFLQFASLVHAPLTLTTAMTAIEILKPLMGPALAIMEWSAAIAVPLGFIGALGQATGLSEQDPVRHIPWKKANGDIARSVGAAVLYTPPVFPVTFAVICIIEIFWVVGRLVCLFLPQQEQAAT